MTTTSLSLHYYQLRIAKELGVIAGVVFVGILALAILQGRIEASANAGASSRTNVNKTNEELERFDHLRTELRATGDVYDGALAALLPTEDIHALTDVVNGLASKHGVVLNFSASAPAPAVPGSPLKLFSIDTSLSLTGDRTQVRGFVSDIEKLPYFYNITRFNETFDQQRGLVTTQLTARLWTKPTQVLTNTNP